MHCRTCGKEVAENAVACMSCGCDPRKGDKFCPNCGAEVNEAQVVCIKCGVALKHSAATGGGNGKKDKTVAGLLAIFLGSLGIHEFYLGNTTSAIIRLAVTILTCGWGGAILGIISLIEGIIYLTKSDEEFQSIYVEGHKAWF